MARHQFKIGGMHCSFCSQSIERAYRGTEGVQKVAVSLAHEEALIEYDEALVDGPALEGILRDVGYTIRDPDKARAYEQQAEELSHKRRSTFQSGIAAGLVAAGMLVMWPGLLPPLTPTESVEVTVAHSVAGLLDPGAGLIADPPFRSPHHTVTSAGLIGGGSQLRPGEASLAHRGVLFLDELGEFRPAVLDALRQPLETGRIRIVRDRGAVTLPGRFQLVAAMNGCPCGYAASVSGRCVCDPWLVRRYLRRLSGPLLDRIDMTYEVPAHRWQVEPDRPIGETSAMVRARVATARRFGRQRGQHQRNVDLATADLRTGCRLDDEGGSILAESARRFGLSTRSCHQVQRVARTIADLAGVPEIRATDVSEALTYRRRLGSSSITG